MFDYSHIQHRKMLLQPLWVIITLGIYGIYWFHVTLGEMYRANNGAEPKGWDRWKWTVLFCIPFLDFFTFWRYGGEYSRFSNGKCPQWLIFVLWIVFLPAVWFLVQRDLNAAARGANSVGR